MKKYKLVSIEKEKGAKGEIKDEHIFLTYADALSALEFLQLFFDPELVVFEIHEV